MTALSRLRAVSTSARARAALAGAVAAGGHAPLGLPVLTLAGLAVAVLLLVRAPRPRAAAGIGWAFGTGYFAVTLHWIVEPFLVDVARHGWMAPFALGLLAGGLALFWAVAFGAAAWLAGPKPAARAGALVVTLTLAEMLRSVAFTGFPWGLIGSVWVDTPLRVWGAWIGPHGMGALTLAIAVGLALGLRPAPRRVLWALASGALLAGMLAAGAIALRAPADSTSATLRVIQPNAAQRLKWRRDMIPVFWQRALDLSAQPPQGATPDLVIWPEVSLFYPLGTAPANDAAVAAAAGGAPTIVGAQRYVGGSLRNALAVIGPDGAVGQVHDKHHLVPFGEYFPGGALVQRLGLTGLATSALAGFTPGPGPGLIDLTDRGLGRALPLICYEAIFPRHARTPRGGPRPDWIVQITNDAWFGRFAGPQQHLAQARMRAVEQGLPLVRAANTGISAVIDPLGRITAALPLGVAGALDAPLPAPRRPTLFARLGNGPVLVGLVLALGGLGLRRRRLGLDLSA